MTHNPSPTTEELLEHYRNGFEGACKNVDLTHKLYAVWRGFAKQAADTLRGYSEFPFVRELLVQYERATVADSELGEPYRQEPPPPLRIVPDDVKWICTNYVSATPAYLMAKEIADEINRKLSATPPARLKEAVPVEVVVESAPPEPPKATCPRCERILSKGERCQCNG